MDPSAAGERGAARIQRRRLWRSRSGSACGTRRRPSWRSCCSQPCCGHNCCCPHGRLAPAAGTGLVILSNHHMPVQGPVDTCFILDGLGSLAVSPWLGFELVHGAVQCWVSVAAHSRQLIRSSWQSHTSAVHTFDVKPSPPTGGGVDGSRRDGFLRGYKRRCRSNLDRRQRHRQRRGAAADAAAAAAAAAAGRRRRRRRPCLARPREHAAAGPSAALGAGGAIPAVPARLAGGGVRCQSHSDM